MQETATSMKLNQLMVDTEPQDEIHDFLNYSLSDGYFSIQGSKNKQQNEKVNNSIQSFKHDSRLDSFPNSPTNKILDQSLKHDHQTQKSLIQYFHIKKFLNRISWKKKINSLFNIYHYNIIDDKGSQFNLRLFRENSINFRPMISQFQDTQFKQKKKQFYNKLKKCAKKSKQQLLDIYKKLDAQIAKVPLINPEARWKIIWDFIIVLARLYFMFVIPMDLAWSEVVFMYGILQVPTILFIILLVFDFLLSFNNSFYQFGQIVNERSKIAAHVISKSYGLEAASLLVLIVFSFVFSSKSFEVQTQGYDLIILIFYVQARNIPNFISLAEETLNLSKPASSILELFKLFLILFFVLHIYSCLWFWVGNYSLTNSSIGSWLLSQKVAEETWQIQYLYSFYFSTVTMFTIGYGDVVPISYLERVIAILYMAICSIQLSYSVSTVGAIIDKISAYGQEKMKKVHTINTYMQNKKISNKLQFQVREYLNYIWQSQSQEETEEQTEIINHLSENLKEQLMIEANSFILNSSELFRTYFSDPLKRKLVRKIKSAVIQPENIIDFDKIFPTNQTGQLYICFIELGEIEIFIQNEGNNLINENPQISIVSKVGKGCTLGTLSFLTGVRSIERFRSVGFTKLLMLSRDDFLKILSEFPEDYEIFRHLHDGIIYTDDRSFLKMKCFSCNSTQHRVIQCPLLHYIPDRELVIKKYVYSNTQQRGTYVRNHSRQRSLVSSLLDQTVIAEEAKKFQNDNWKWAEFYEEPGDEVETKELIKTDSFEVENLTENQVLPESMKDQPLKKKVILRSKTKQLNEEEFEGVGNNKQRVSFSSFSSKIKGQLLAPIMEEQDAEKQAISKLARTNLATFKKAVFIIKNMNQMKKKRMKKSLRQAIMNTFINIVLQQQDLKNQLTKVKIRLKNIEDGKKQILSERDIIEIKFLEIKLNMLINYMSEYQKKDQLIIGDSFKHFKHYQTHNNLKNILYKNSYYEQQKKQSSNYVEIESRLLNYMLYPQIYMEKYKLQPFRLSDKKASKVEEVDQNDQHKELENILSRKSRIIKKSFRNKQIRPLSDGSIK